MNYDENIFKEKANRKARKIWLIFALLLSANYGSDVANGLQKAITISSFDPVLAADHPWRDITTCQRVYNGYL